MSVYLERLHGMLISLTLRSILVSILLMCGTGFSSAGTDYCTPNTELTTHAQEKRIHELRPGKRVTLELRGGEVHSYQVVLSSGEYLRVIVDQLGIDVVVTLFGPDDQKLTEVDSPNGILGPEPVSVISEVSGEFRLEVKSLRETSPPGRYEIRIEELRQSSSHDVDRIDTERKLAEAERLRMLGTIESLRQALEKYKEGLLLLRAMTGRVGENKSLTAIEGDSLHAIGLIYYLLGEPQNSLESLREALMKRRLAGDQRGEGSTLIEIAQAHNLGGDLQKALSYYELGLSLLRKFGDRTQEASTLRHLGNLYSSLGEPQLGLTRLNEALIKIRETGDRREEAEVLRIIGNTLLSVGRFQEAGKSLNDALLLERATNHRVGEGLTLFSLGGLQLLLHDYEGALKYFHDCLFLLSAIGRFKEPDLLTAIGETYFRLGKKDDALRYLRKAMSVYRDIGSTISLPRTLYFLACVDRARGRLHEARGQIETVLEIVERSRSSLVSQELRTSFTARNQVYYRFYIDLLMQMHRHEPSSGYDALALKASERARARSLLETLNEVRADIRHGVDGALLDSERMLQQRLNAKSVALMSLVSSQHNEELEAELRRDLDLLLTDYRTIEAQIRAASPQYAALTRPEPFSLEEIRQQVLDGETLLLQYALGEEHSYLWAVSADSFRSFELPKGAEIEAKARRVYDLIISKADAQHSEALDDLSRTLLGPVADQLGNKQLLIVGEGALQYVPFGALPKPLVNPEQSSSKLRTPNKYEPLILDHEITYSQSASVVGVLRQREMSAGTLAASQQLLVFADPVFVKEDQRVKRAREQRTSKGTKRTSENNQTTVPSVVERSAKHLGLSRFDRLPLSRREAELIIKLYPKAQSRKALDFDANRSIATSPDVAQYRIVHFATHSLLNNDHPELSGIVLSLVDEQGNAQDGFLRLHDIYNLKLSADLVVLSACQTALGKEIKGEGLVGLTRGFMYAGAPRVVASLWKLSDSSTAELMTRFYENMLVKKMKPVTALRTAQISMFKERQWAAPYYWAGFIMQGEWR